VCLYDHAYLCLCVLYLCVAREILCVCHREYVSVGVVCQCLISSQMLINFSSVFFCISALTCHFSLTSCEHTYTGGNHPPFLRGFTHLIARNLHTPSHQPVKFYGAHAICIGTHWPGHGCRDVVYSIDQICGPASTLPQILTPTLHRHVETLWPPPHEFHS
jgi:hypothetical protein